jgi:hypothetical protein
MTATCRAAAVLSALLGLAVTAAASDQKLSDTLKGVMENHVRAYDAQDTDGVLRTMHTQSPAYEPTRAALAGQLRSGLGVTLVDFHYMGHDSEFAVARVRMKTLGPPGSDFAGNVTDNIMLFHQEGGVWKLWGDDILGVQFTSR